MVFKVCFLFLIVLCSCSHKGTWISSSIKTGNLEFDSFRLFYPSKELNLEILCTQGFLHSCFQVQSHTISSHQNNPKEALLTFIIEGISYSDIVSLHEGGQRVSLSKKMEEILISSLMKNLSVIVHLGSSETIIKAEKFADYYNEQQRSFPFLRY